MYRISLIGLSLLLALLTAKACQKLKLPKVSGFLLLGLAVGPSGLVLIDQESLEQLAFLSRIAIALVLFDIGGEFDVREIKRLGGRHILISIVECTVTGLAVGGAAWALGAPVPAAVALGILAMDTSPTVTVLVIKEYQSRGPLTQLILAVVAMNVVIAITSFYLVMGILDGIRVGHPGPLLWTTGKAVGGALLAGTVVGLLLEVVARRLQKEGDLLMLVFGTLLCIVGYSAELGMSAMLATIVGGAVVANRHTVRGRLFDVLKPITGLLYAMFFILAGASLHLELLQGIGTIGIAYVITRAGGKMFGSFLGVRLAGVPFPAARWLPLSSIPHGGVAIALSMTLGRLHPEFSALVSVVVLSGVMVFEIVGPFSTRLALWLAGEDQAPVSTYDLDVLESGQDSTSEASAT